MLRKKTATVINNLTSFGNLLFVKCKTFSELILHRTQADSYNSNNTGIKGK